MKCEHKRVVTRYYERELSAITVCLDCEQEKLAGTPWCANQRKRYGREEYMRLIGKTLIDKTYKGGK